ncbi:TetR family transcriptional regulator [candidate division KSB1 bacterium]|nr:TetR family transcriptional regulator [candidate division KSB1 bacterium]
MRRTREDSEATHQQLLKAGLRIFSEKGYAAARLSDVAYAAGVTRGAIYWHFKNKKDLFLALFRKNVDPLFDTIKDVLEDKSSPLGKIRTILTIVLEKIDTDADFRANQNLEFAETKLLSDIPELQQYLTNRAANSYKLFIDMIESGVKNGEIRNDIDANSVINIFSAMIRGYCFISSRKDFLTFAGDIDTEQMINIFIQGLKA